MPPLTSYKLDHYICINHYISMHLKGSLNGSSFAAHLHSGELVAVKVQRPGMSESLTLDALLFNMVGGQLKRFAKARKDLLVAVNEMVRILTIAMYFFLLLLCTTFLYLLVQL